MLPTSLVVNLSAGPKLLTHGVYCSLLPEPHKPSKLVGATLALVTSCSKHCYQKSAAPKCPEVTVALTRGSVNSQPSASLGIPWHTHSLSKIRYAQGGNQEWISLEQRWRAGRAGQGARANKGQV